MYLDGVAGKRGRTPSPELVRFKNKALLALGRQWAHLPKLEDNQPYLLVLVFYFDKLVNASWNPGKKSGASSRYKKQDVSNYLKPTEDVISTVACPDDSANLAVYIAKSEDPNNPRVEAIICNMNYT